MPPLPYGRGAYRRDTGNLAEFKLVNFYLEQTPADEKGVVLISRPGLEASATRGSGPVDGIFSQEGTFGGDVFTVSGNVLYRGATTLGAVTGTGPVSWAASATEVVLTRGGTAYSYNGTNLAAIAFPDSASVTAVAFLAGLFVFARAGGHKFYWSAVLDGRTVDALDFASAESAPDSIRDIIELGDNIYLMGQRSIEVWAAGGPLDVPFTRILQRTYEKGVYATGAAVPHDNSIAFVGHEGIVYRLADVPQRISDHAIEERIKDSSTARVFRYVHDGHDFFCLRLDYHTFAWDAATGQWSEMATYGRANFRGQCATNVAATAYFGDDENGTVWTFGETFADAGTILEGYFTAGAALNGGTERFDNVEVRANVGWTNSLSGDAANPVIEMRSSRDAGATWGAWQAVSLGSQGNYRTRAVWNRCGVFDSPGALFEFRVTDQTPRRISGVFYNEAGGGRSR